MGKVLWKLQVIALALFPWSSRQCQCIAALHVGVPFNQLHSRLLKKGLHLLLRELLYQAHPHQLSICDVRLCRLRLIPIQGRYFDALLTRCLEIDLYPPFLSIPPYQALVSVVVEGEVGADLTIEDS